MRDIFTEIFENQPLDPSEAARRGAKPLLRKRFYTHAASGPLGEGGFPVLLDGKPVRTPARRILAAPAAELAAAIAAEWQAQTDVIDPALMPLTRLAHAVIDAVADQADAVVAEIEKYLGSDLVCYRAEAPAGLVERQSQAWDPLLAWAQDTHGARFVLTQGIVHVPQQAAALAAMRAAIPLEPWRLGALSSITLLTGSALIALALAAGRLDTGAAWAAAHVDEDWQMTQWGRDDPALAARAFHFKELEAAATVLELMR